MLETPKPDARLISCYVDKRNANVPVTFNEPMDVWVVLIVVGGRAHHRNVAYIVRIRDRGVQE